MSLLNMVDREFSRTGTIIFVVKKFDNATSVGVVGWLRILTES